MTENYSIALFGTLLLVTLTFLLASADIFTLDIGCYVIGSEVNGDYSTEYLLAGNC